MCRISCQAALPYIARNGTALVKLVPIEAPGKRRVLGKDQGKIRIAEDFDAPVPELEEPS